VTPERQRENLMSHFGSGRRLAVLSALAVLGLAGCGQEAPGVAASIDGEQVTMDQVDSYANAVCTYNEVNAEVSGQPPQAVSGEDLRGFALNLLVQQALTERVAEEVGASVPAAAGAQAVDPQTEEVIAAMPADEGAVISEIVSTSQRNAALQQAIGTALAGEGAGQRAVAAALADEEADADIEIDPRLAEAYAARAQERGASAPTQESQLAVPVSAEDAGEDAPSCS
jgi:hypothetical protein